MFPLGNCAVRSLVVGDERLEAALSGWHGPDGGTFDVTAVDAAAVEEVAADGATVGDATDDETADGDAAIDETADGVPTGGSARFADLSTVDRPVDCLVVDAALPAVDPLSIVEQWTGTRPGAPVILLVASGTDEVVTAGLAAGATEALPRRVLDDDPDLLAERVRDAVEADRARTGLTEFFDGVGAMVTLHDPASGDLLDGNRRACALLGYERSALRSMAIGEITADVSGHDRERAERLVASAGSQDRALELEWPFETADGGVRWVESRLDTARVGAREVVVWSSHDVTERRRQARTYEQVFDDVNDVIAVHDPWAEELVDVNETMTDLTGYGPDTLLEMGVAGFCVADDGADAAETYEAQQRVAATGDPERTEWVVETADGERRRLEVNLAPATIAGEDRVLALGRDVTEKRRLERTYRDLFEKVADGLLVHDPETGEILDANERFCEMNGYAKDELVGATVGKVTAPGEEYSNEAARRMVRRAQEEGPQLFEWRNQREDGEEFPVEVHLQIARIHGEERVLASVRDISERKRREREYEQIFDGVEEAIVVQDPETAEPVDANRAFLERLGYDDVEAIRREGLAGLSATEAGYTKERARELCDRVMETGEPETVEWQQVTKDGDRRWIEATVDAAVVRGEDRILSMQRDVTERKRRERMVRALHESTDDLQDAETPEAVCEAAVDAATEVLDLWLPTCWLRGADGPDVLTPVASGDEARNLAPGDRPRPLEPGDLEYDVYEAGERGVYDPAALDGGTPPGDAVLVPLGEHGLFGAVERSAAGFDDVALDMAGILARHVTAALDRVERARELRESERRFRLIAEHIDEIVYLATADFSEILYINDAYEQIYDRPVSELAEDPTSFVEAAHPDDRDQYRADVERLVADLEAGTPRDAYGGEYRIERGGETRWVTVTRFPVENEDGTVDRVVGRVQDVTERKRREREYEQIFDGVHDAIVVVDPETLDVLDANEASLDVFGYEDFDAVRELGVEGLDATGSGHSADRPRDVHRRVSERGEPETVEWRVETRDGEHRWLESTVAPAVIGGEAVNVAINRDVTERRRVERRLGEILDRIDEAVFMTRADEITAASQSPDYVSSGYEAIWGRSLAEIRDAYDAGFFGTLHPDDEAEYRAHVERIVDEIADGSAADSYSHEYRIERPDGEVRWVQSDYYPADWESGAPRIVIVSRDVTDRKSRERRIASFDDATDDLATADTPEEATRTAVDAASETLDLPAVGAFLYDGDDGVLRPEVLAGPLPADVAADPIGPGDGPLWEAFATGTIVASDGGRREAGFVGEEVESPAALADLAEWRALALGNHGILLVGSPETALESETIQAAHVLAATLEAALNHLAGERRLAAREEQLRTQTERADRLDRIASLAQQVEAAITDASDPGEVERAVPDRLAGSGPYELAWVGGVEVGSDRLAARAVVGASEQYVDRLDLSTTDDAADVHPAVAAWRTDEVQVADSIVGDGPAGDWRSAVLSAGYQSLCAVPLTYDGVTHGVLTVGTDSPNAFGDRERDVLAQLGTSIGYALAAIERRRALESDETVELEFAGSGQSLPFARAAAECDCRVRLERTVARQDGSVSVYFGFEGDVPPDAAEIAGRTLAGTVDVVTDGSSTTLVEARTDDWFGSPLAEYGAVLREAVADADETTVTVEVPTQADVRSFVDRLHGIAPSLELVARRQHRRRDRTTAELGDEVRSALTDRQLEVLETAVSAGYFEWPRENDGNEVADRLGITQPTLNKHLRLAEQKTFGILLDAEA